MGQRGPARRGAHEVKHYGIASGYADALGSDSIARALGRCPREHKAGRLDGSDSYANEPSTTPHFPGDRRIPIF
ncbi:hypothetical protein GCM10023350_08800 [Nocardioides endophyticus]|uniref:Uncharacterized protein n=1 Tax=Nocardioides endophyticus TaxID=1353775 RepID=A0ABP8YG54_9ACTN